MSPPVGSGGNEGCIVQRGLCRVQCSDQEGKGLRSWEMG